MAELVRFWLLIPGPVTRVASGRRRRPGSRGSDGLRPRLSRCAAHRREPCRPGRFPVPWSANRNPADGGPYWPAHARAKPLFTYMTSSGRLFVPFLFNFCSPVLHINGRGQAGSGRPRSGRGRVRASCRWMRNRRKLLSVAVLASARSPGSRSPRAPLLLAACGRPSIVSPGSAGRAGERALPAAAVLRRHLVRGPDCQDRRLKI